jgi:hypothetical protein
MTSPTRADIWQTFSKIKRTTNLNSDPANGGEVISYVNWMDTLAEARSYYPEIGWEHWTYEDGGEVFYFLDQTAEVKATILIGEVEHTTTLPVTDSNWNPIINPNANDINTAKKRCLCKCLGELGLYWQLWSKVERDGFISKSNIKVLDNNKSNIKVAANEELVVDADPAVSKVPETEKDIEVVIQQFYNGEFADHVKSIRNHSKVIDAVSKIHNKARNLYQGNLTDHMQKKFNQRVAEIKSIDIELIKGGADGS